MWKWQQTCNRSDNAWKEDKLTMLTPFKAAVLAEIPDEKIVFRIKSESTNLGKANFKAMRNEERSVSTGTVVAFGFIILGILNLFATFFYHRTSINTQSRLPGILFITVGVVIFVIRFIKNQKA